MTTKAAVGKGLLVLVMLFLSSCASSHNVYEDENMDFGAIETVAVMPLLNLSRDSNAAERVRDVLMTRLLATGTLYILPAGEVARGISKTELANPATPSPEEVVKLGGILKVQAVISGVLREYGEVKSGTASANAIALSVQMVETQTGKVVWAASSTKGGISVTDRLFGGGGQPMEKVTEEAVDDLIRKLFEQGPSSPEEEKTPAQPTSVPPGKGEKGKPASHAAGK